MFTGIDWGTVLLLLPCFLLALTVHEFAHALTANWGGDLTATDEKRLTLNPLSHIDPLGTVLVPLVAAMSGYVFGWARPVPVNEANFRDKSWNVVVALAGPYSNLLLAIGTGIVMAIGLQAHGYGASAGWWPATSPLAETLLQLGVLFVHVNVFLMFFNLLPVPPLDGSHVLYHFVVRGRGHLYGPWEGFRQFGFMILIVLMMTGALQQFFSWSTAFTMGLLRLTYAG
jgi:Zn-dependent protease